MTKEEQMTETTTTDSLESMEWRLFDIRFAAVLNLMDIAKDHGGHRDWTDRHAEQIRGMLTTSDRVVQGDSSAVVPSGFGEPVRTRMGELMRETLDARRAMGLPKASTLDVRGEEEKKE